MQKIVFKKIKNDTNEYDTFDLTMVSEGTDLTQIIEDFELFLKGMGYNLDGKRLILQEE